MHKCLPLLFLLGCAGTSPEEELVYRQSMARPRAAAYGSDGFFQGLSVKQQDQRLDPDAFFFKKCRIVDRRIYPAMNVWECEGGGQ
ncbi:MAG: hypothetical protein NZ480_06870 [Bdellovibrionaceae bacterium]|nr:hypothetical protein [Pseudobdellovibrionaceae bacterium]MDW8190308.1 hypothetical protein [Pseudobdellovibrionaceae bacterium]